MSIVTKQVVRAAAVQAAPIHMNLAASLDKAIGLIEQAKREQCDLIVFGEAWLPGYPWHIWLGPPAWTFQFTKEYFDNCVSLDGPEIARLKETARKHGIAISMGYSEKDGGSLYLGQCLIDTGGEIVFARRKLKPTHVERSFFGEGYGDDLTVVDTALGRIGALCCWEHLQPLSKYALYAQREAIHCAAWPAFAMESAYALGKEVNMGASQLYAVEGQCFVIAATSVIDQQTLDTLRVDDSNRHIFSLGGGSAMIFAPDGRPMMDYLSGTEEGLQIADLPMEAIVYAKAVADPAGHYAKPDATQLVLHRQRRSPMILRADTGPAGKPDGSDDYEQEWTAP